MKAKAYRNLREAISSRAGETRNPISRPLPRKNARERGDKKAASFELDCSRTAQKVIWIVSSPPIIFPGEFLMKESSHRNDENGQCFLS